MQNDLWWRDQHLFLFPTGSRSLLDAPYHIGITTERWLWFFPFSTPETIYLIDGFAIHETPTMLQSCKCSTGGNKSYRFYFFFLMSHRIGFGPNCGKISGRNFHFFFYLFSPEMNCWNLLAVCVSVVSIKRAVRKGLFGYKGLQQPNSKRRTGRETNCAGFLIFRKKRDILLNSPAAVGPFPIGLSPGL